MDDRIKDMAELDKTSLPDFIYFIMSDKYSKSTVKRYGYWYKKYIQHSDDKDEDETDILNSINYFINNTLQNTLLKTNKEYTSVLSVAITICNIVIERQLKISLTKQFTKKRDELVKLIRDARENQKIVVEPTEKDLENEISAEDIENLEERYDKMDIKNMSPRDIYKKLFLKFITSIPVLRTQDYINTKMTDDPNYNFMDTQNSILIIKGGKTKNSIRNIDIPRELNDLIKDIDLKIKSDWLFPKLQSLTKQQNSASFNKYLTRFFESEFEGKKISTNRLRQIFSANENKKQISQEQEIANAVVMGHSYSTHQQKYKKYTAPKTNIFLNPHEQENKELKKQLLQKNEELLKLYQQLLNK